jgi:hypothetical protein
LKLTIEEVKEDWRKYSEEECQEILSKNPFNNYARFRAAQIWIHNNDNLEEAQNLLESLQQKHPDFMQIEILMLMGERMECEQI